MARHHKPHSPSYTDPPAPHHHRPHHPHHHPRHAPPQRQTAQEPAESAPTLPDPGRKPAPPILAPYRIGTLPHAVTECIAILSALDSSKQREQALGLVMARLIEQAKLPGASGVLQEVIRHTDRYRHVPDGD